MSVLTPIALFGWLPVVLAIFAALPARRAVIGAFIFAWLFLPMAGYALPGLPDYTKMSATCVGVLLATAVFDSERFAGFRPGWVDLPIATWCLLPLGTSLASGAGAYDGLSAVVNQTITWGVPYFIGRLYLNDWTGLRELALGMFIGALVYVPLCLYELRMSPQLHRMVYGFHAHDFAQTKRYGGWRPTVFMQHGLMVGMWMCTATLIGLWLWRVGGVRRLLGVPMAPLVLLVGAVAVLCKSVGAVALLGAGMALLWLSLRSRRYTWLTLAALLPCAYVGARAGLGWSGAPLPELVAAVDPERAASLQARLTNEGLLIENGQRHLLTGMGRGWLTVSAVDSRGALVRREATPDALWVILLARNGLPTVAAMLATLVLPALLWTRRIPAHTLHVPITAAPFALVVLLLLYALDNLMNAMINPVFMLAGGGVLGLLAEMARQPHLPGFVPRAPLPRGALP